MAASIQIIARNMEPSPAVEAAIREHAEKLESRWPEVMRVTATIEEPHRHHHQGRLFNVRLLIHTPGHEFALNRNDAEDIYVSIRDVFDDAKRELERALQRQRGDVKAHELVKYGVVARLAEDGFGFIRTPEGDEYYFDREALAGIRFDHLNVGDPVHFLPSLEGDTPQAKRVTAAHPPA